MCVAVGFLHLTLMLRRRKVGRVPFLHSAVPVVPAPAQVHVLLRHCQTTQTPPYPVGSSRRCATKTIPIWPPGLRTRDHTPAALCPKPELQELGWAHTVHVHCRCTLYDIHCIPVCLLELSRSMVVVIITVAIGPLFHIQVFRQKSTLYVKNFIISYSIHTSYNNNNTQRFDHWSSSSAYNIVWESYDINSP